MGTLSLPSLRSESVTAAGMSSCKDSKLPQDSKQDRRWNAERPSATLDP